MPATSEPIAPVEYKPDEQSSQLSVSSSEHSKALLSSVSAPSKALSLSSSGSPSSHRVSRS